MPRPEKVAAVAEIKERIEGAKAVFLAEYAGLSVKQQQALRRGLREQGAEFKVVKMTLARRAIADMEVDEFDELLIGPTGLAFADTDAVSTAKVLKEFAASHDVFALKGGLLGSEFLTAERIAHLAEIAPRPELLAMLAGAMKAPLTAMAGLLAALPRGAATVFQQLLEKKESGEYGGGVPVDATESPAVEEPAAVETSEAEVTTAAAGNAEAESDAEAEPESGVEAETGADAESEAEAASESEAASADSDEESGDVEVAPDAAEEAEVSVDATEPVDDDDSPAPDGEEPANGDAEDNTADASATAEAASEEVQTEDEPAASGEEDE